MKKYVVDERAFRMQMAKAGVLSFADLSRRSGVTTVTIRRIVQGKIRPSTSTLDAIASAMDADANDIGSIFFNPSVS